MMSKIYNYPVSVDDITFQMNECSPMDKTDQGNQEHQKKRIRSERKRHNSFYLANRDKPKRRNYYLIPVGGTPYSSGLSRNLPKWIDVQSIMIRGIHDHRNITPRRVTRRTPLETGGLTSVMIKNQAFSVFPINPSMVNMRTLLATNIEQRVFNETHAKFVCVNLLMALRYLHEHGVFHGSIAPKKVVFNERCYPCLTGFVTADNIDERQSRPRERLELSYTTPEQLFNEHMTEGVDIYSLGCVIYAMVYGRPPHEMEDNPPTSPATRRNIIDKDFGPRFSPDTMSSTGKRFILRCINKNARRRYSLIHARDTNADDPWLDGMSEEKLYKQAAPSPLLDIIQKHVVT